MLCECGTPLRPGQAFCGQCGRAVPQAAEESAVSLSRNTAPLTGFAMPFALTTQTDDFWKLGALAVLLLSLFFPAVSLPAGLALSPIQLGLWAWLAVLIVLALAALTAVPAWRPRPWPAIERFLSAALVGSVVTVLGMVWTAAHILSRMIQSFTSSTGGFGSFLAGSFGRAASYSVHVDFGLVLALAGTVAWAILTRRVR